MTGATVAKKDTLADEAKKLAAAAASTAPAPSPALVSDELAKRNAAPDAASQRAIDWAGDPNAFLPQNTTDIAKAEAAASAVPKTVDTYQDTVEAGRLKPATTVPKTNPEPAPMQTRPSAALATKTAADSATEIAAAPRGKVGEVIEKLKQEEKKGGPNLFDILEAAAAGWQGNTPAYVQRKMQAAAKQADEEKMQEAARLQAEEMERRFSEERELRAAEQAQERELRLAEIASAEKRAGLMAPIGSGRLRLDEIGLGK